MALVNLIQPKHLPLAIALPHLGRLKNSRNLNNDKPGHFAITEVGRVAGSRENATAQRENITRLFPNEEETAETTRWDDDQNQNQTKSLADHTALIVAPPMPDSLEDAGKRFWVDAYTES